MTARAQAGLALALLVLGAAAALLSGSQSWQTVRASRPRPLADEVVAVVGHRLDPAATALAAVALAGVVALLATRGVARRIVGAVVALAGVVLIWRSASGLRPVSDSRAGELVAGANTGVGLSGARLGVVVHPVWPALSLAGGVLVVAGGVLAVIGGARWSAMSARYEAPTAAGGRPGHPGEPGQPGQSGQSGQRGAARSDASLWTAIDRGDDPTAD